MKEKTFYIDGRAYIARIKELEPNRWVAFCPGVAISYGEGGTWWRAFMRMLKSCRGTIKENRN